jgi:hypothetical protein
MRYRSEAEQVRAYADSVGVKSLLIRINRFETSESRDPSERDMDDYQGFDLVIENKGTLEEFKEKLLEAVFSNL